MKDQANHNELKEYRTVLLVSGVIVGMIILLFVLSNNDVSLQRMFF
ncbi:MAG TPA: hypothetical protein VK658_18425 [Chryseolinea sp.]|nr:hypothetical protein [Chryseolinea sp.]